MSRNSSLMPSRLHSTVEHTASAVVFLLLGLWWFIHILVVTTMRKSRSQVAGARRLSLPSLSVSSETGSRTDGRRRRRMNSPRLPGDVWTSKRDHDVSSQPIVSGVPVFISQVGYSNISLGRGRGGHLRLDQLAIVLLSTTALVCDIALSKFDFSEETAGHFLHAAMWAFLVQASISSCGLIAVHRTVQYTLFSLAFCACALLWTVQSLGEGLSGISTLHLFLAAVLLLIAISLALECVFPSSDSLALARPALFVLAGAWSGVCGTIIFTQFDNWSGWDRAFWQRVAASIVFAWTVCITGLVLVVVSYIVRKLIDRQDAVGRLAHSSWAIPPMSMVLLGNKASNPVIKDCRGDFSVLDRSPRSLANLWCPKQKENKSGEEIPLLEFTLAKTDDADNEPGQGEYSVHHARESLGSVASDSSLSSCELSSWLTESMNTSQPRLSVSVYSPKHHATN